MYNRASAASMLMFLIIVILSSVVFYIMRDKYAAKIRKEEKNYIKERRKAEKSVRRGAN